MTISKSAGLGTMSSSAGATLTTTTFDSTGYTHVVVFTKHETNNTNGAVPSDNKGSTDWASLPQQQVTLGGASWGQFHWAKIGTPGAGHTVTMTTNAASDFRTSIVWLVNSTVGKIAVLHRTEAGGNSTAVSAGTLLNPNALSIVSFLGVAEFSAATYNPSSGWTEDFDPNGTPNYTYGASRGPEAATSIAADATASATLNFGACAVSFREVAGLTSTTYQDFNDAGSAGGDITSASRTFNVGELVIAIYKGATGAATKNNITISNSGTAQTWTLIKEVENAAADAQLKAYYCVMSVTQAMTINFLGDSSNTTVSMMETIRCTGQHATTPIPVGNAFGNFGGTDISQAITPTSSGSALWLSVSDWGATNTYAAAANCTIEQTHQLATQHTTALIRPITQPRTDAAAFTIGETDTAGRISWIAFEVQAAASSQATVTSNSRTPPVYEFDGIPNVALRNVMAWF